MAETQTTEVGRRVGTATTTREPGARTLSGGVKELVDSARELGAAQWAIWSLKATRIAVAAGIGLVSMVLLVLLMAYGFTLLDAALDWQLSQLGIAPWFSPLVRGAVYFGVPLLGLVVAWHTLVGYGTAEKERREGAKGQS
jgi:hypothetical protein